MPYPIQIGIHFARPGGAVRNDLNSRDVLSGFLGQRARDEKSHQRQGSRCYAVPDSDRNSFCSPRRGGTERPEFPRCPERVSRSKSARRKIPPAPGLPLLCRTRFAISEIIPACPEPSSHSPYARGRAGRRDRAAPDWLARRFPAAAALARPPLPSAWLLRLPPAPAAPARPALPPAALPQRSRVLAAPAPPQRAARLAVSPLPRSRRSRSVRRESSTAVIARSISSRSEERFFPSFSSPFLTNFETSGEIWRSGRNRSGGSG